MSNEIFLHKLICSFQSIDFSSNRMAEPDPTESLTDCLPNLSEIKLNSNGIASFPSFMIYNKPNLVNLYFQNNRLEEIPLIAFRDPSRLTNIDFSTNQITSFELWTLLVQQSADLRNNPMTKIGNKYGFRFPNTSTTLENVQLSSTAIFTLTDAIFPMYDICPQAVNLESIILANGGVPNNLLLYKIGYISFGSTRFNCSCAQYYILRSLSDNTGGGAGLPLFSGNCTDGSLFSSADACDITSAAGQSSVDYTQVIPRFCRITETDNETLTNATDLPIPTSILAAVSFVVPSFLL